VAEEAIKADFLGDWLELMRAALKAAGLPTQSLTTLADVSLAYWNYRARLIAATPRKVHRAREFSCPAQHAAAVDALQIRFEHGEDVNKHRSRGAFDPEHGAFNDRLLNDWGVQHFHLGADNPNDVVTYRTGHCLYVYLTSGDAYFLDVMHHGNYHKQELMLRMHRNWPEAIAEHRAPGVLPDDQWDDDSIKTLRRAGLTYLLNLDGVAYVAPGGGYMSSGHSWLVCRRSDHALNRLVDWQKRLESEGADIVEQLHREGYTPAKPPSFKLLVRNDWYCSAVEYTARTKIDIGYLFVPRGEQ
jgi:hypothetical protein